MTFLLAACGDKLPQSETARKVGEQPKQLLDKVSSDVNKSVQQGTVQDPEEKK